MKSHGINMKGTFKPERESTLPAIATPGREIFVDDKRYYGSDGTSWQDYAIAENATVTENLMVDWPMANKMGGNGRFAGDVGWDIYTTTFTNDVFFTPYNSGSAASAGEFIHNNTTFGGSAGALTSTVEDLIDTMGRTGSDARYGVEFFVCQINCGTGTAISDTFPGGTRYLMTTNGNRCLGGNYGYHTLCAWLRAIGGSIGLRGSAYSHWELDGVTQTSSNYDLSTSDGWVFYLSYRQDAIGYNTAYPYWYGNSGSSLQIAIPAYFSGRLRNIRYTAPLVSR